MYYSEKSDDVGRRVFENSEGKPETVLGKAFKRKRNLQRGMKHLLLRWSDFPEEIFMKYPE